MASNKSLKLLNYSKSVNSKLQLFTELTHDFNIGDYVYISGGYFDNTQNLLKSEGIFNKTKKGYKILNVNSINNSFIIDYDIEEIDLIYPYGVLLNKFGNPQDTVNLAYNNYLNDDLYKSVYVSKVIFSSGTINKNIINNGVYGTYNLPINLNGWPYTQSNIIINHMIGVNIISNGCTINSKTDTSQSLITEIGIKEDSSISLTNPFSTYTKNISINNKTYGYNIFDKFTQKIDTQLTINNGVFSGTNDIYIINTNIFGGKYGSNEIKSELLMYSVSINNSDIFDLNVSDVFNTYNSNVNTFIDIKVLNAEYTTTSVDGYNGFKLNVGYDFLANKVLTLAVPYIMFGIKNSLNFDILNSVNDFNLIDAYYTFGDIDSAYIEIELPDFSDIDWDQYILDNDINSLDFSNFKIHKKSNTYWSEETFFNFSKISTYAICDYSININDFIRCENSEINTGYYNNVGYNNTDIIGSYNEPVFMKNTYNLFYTYSDETIPNKIISGAHIDVKTTIKGNISDSEIINGLILNSTISNSVVSNDEQNTFIYNSTLNDGSKIKDNVFWDKIKINFIGPTDILLNNEIKEVSYLGKRKTKFIVGTNNSISDNINRIILFGTQGYYNSQHKITSSTGGKYTLKFDVPNLFNVNSNNVIDLTEFDTQIAIIQEYDAKYTAPISTWERDNVSGIRILYGSNPYTNSDTEMVTKLTNKSVYYITGTSTTFPGLAYDDPSITKSDLTGVPDTVIYTNPNYTYFTTNNRPIYITTSINTINKTRPYFPDYTLNEPNIDTNIWLELNTNIGPDITNIHNNDGIVSPISVPSGISKFKLRLNNVFVDYNNNLATTVLNSFIEVERLVIIKRDSITDAILDYTITNCNFNPTGINDFNNKVYSTYPTSIDIKDSTNNNLSINLDNTTDTYIETHLEYWITWFYQFYIPMPNILFPENLYTDDTIISGHRTKHVIKNKFVYSNETYNLITVSGDNLITNNNENINYNY